MTKVSDSEFMIALQGRLREKISSSDCGPFLAALVDEQGRVIAEEENCVVGERSSHAHAEMRAITAAEKKLDSYDLSAYNFTLYTTSEPCMMCAGGILWSGIKRVVFGVSTAEVEAITGFDEGVKSGWREGFAARGIEVVGPVEEPAGIDVLKFYMSRKGIIYRPRR